MPVVDLRREGVQPGERTTDGSSRLLVAAVACAISIALPALGLSGAWVAVTMLTGGVVVAAALAPAAETVGHRLGVAALIPVGFLSWVVVFAAGGQLASLIGFSAWGSRTHSLAVWTMANLAFVAVAAVRRGRVFILRPDGPGVAVGLAVALVGVGVALLQPFEVWARDVSQGTDLNRHLMIMKSTLATGQISYIPGTTEYPRAIHSWMGTTWSASGGTTYADAWMAGEGTLWILTACIALAVGATAVRVARRLATPRWVSDLVVPVVVFVSFIQGAWVIAIFPGGFLTTIFAGMVLAAMMLLGWDGVWLGTLRSVLMLAVAIIALAQSWPILLPIPGILMIVTLVVGLRRRSLPIVPVVVVCVFGALVALPPLLALVRGRTGAGDVGSDLAMFGYSGLWTPRLWWIAVAVVAVVAAGWLWRRGERDWSGAYLVLLTSGAVLVFLLFWWSGSGWETPNYYPIKALWTLSPLVLAPGVAGVFWLLTALFRFAGRQEAGPRRLAALGVAAVVVTVLAAGVAGRLVGTPSVVVPMLAHGGNGLPLNIPTITSLESQGVSADPQTKAIAFGIAPYGSVAEQKTVVGLVDWLATESLNWMDMDGMQGTGVLRMVQQRDMKGLCDYLRQNPDAVRVTGPNPASGYQWFLDSGCPKEVVKPEEWISVEIPDAWFEHLTAFGQPYRYPTWDEYREFMESNGGNTPMTGS